MTMINKIIFFFYTVDLISFATAVFPITFISYISVLNLASFHVGEFGSCHTLMKDRQLNVSRDSEYLQVLEVPSGL